MDGSSIDTSIDKYFSRLEAVFMEMVRRLHSELAGQMIPGITGSQYLVLNAINSQGRLTVSEVAEKLGVSLSAITALVNRLVKAGLVARSRDELDRRMVWLEATEQGKETLAKCMESRRKVTSKYFSQLTVEDMKKLIEIYDKVLAAMREDEKKKSISS